MRLQRPHWTYPSMHQAEVATYECGWKRGKPAATLEQATTLALTESGLLMEANSAGPDLERS
jgi:hypothetical protein